MTVAFTSPVDVNMGLQMSANNFCSVYFDNLRITEVEKASELDEKKISVLTDKEILTEINTPTEDFRQKISLESLMNYDFADEEGNPIIEIGHVQLTVIDSGIVFRPSVLSDVCMLTYSNAQNSDNGITNMSINTDKDTDINTLKLVGSIDGILQLYGKTDFDISFYLLLKPVNGSGVVSLHSEVVSTNIFDIYQNHLSDDDPLYADNENLKDWIEGITE